jgi:hypothetical protein
MVDGHLKWQNYAGTSWNLSLDTANRRLLNLAPTPYPGEWFTYELALDPSGRPTSVVAAIRPTGNKSGDLPLARVPFAICDPAASTLCADLRDFYYSRGGTGAFTPAFHKVVDADVLAWLDLEAGDYASAHKRLAGVWRDFPRGSPAWDNLTNQHGSMLDDPPGQMVTLMLQRIVDAGPTPPANVKPVPLKLTVAIAECIRGTMPSNQAELKAGKGKPLTVHRNPAILANNYAALRQGLAVFQKYGWALLGRRGSLDVTFAPLPAGVCYDAQVSWDGSRPFVGPTDAAKAAILASVPPRVRDATDWWLLLYPTLLPQNPNNFDSNEWVTGGDQAATGGAVLNVADIDWFLRKPPHFVSKPHTPFSTVPWQNIERFFYHPRWLDHETHHHLFDDDFPELKLEVPAGSHSWFKRETWPADFVGNSEPEYFDQADFRRLQTAHPPIWVRARFAAPTWNTTTNAALAGRYEACREPGWTNDTYAWNKGTLSLIGGVLTWANDAGTAPWHLKSWHDDATIPLGRLRQIDGPYTGQYWQFHFARDPSTGANLSTIQGYDSRNRCPAGGCRCP